MTGSMPGMAASTRLTLALGAAPNEVEAPENSFASDVTCAWTSRPMMTSQSPVAPGMRRFASGVRVSMMDMAACQGLESVMVSLVQTALGGKGRGACFIVATPCFRSLAISKGVPRCGEVGSGAQAQASLV